MSTPVWSIPAYHTDEDAWVAIVGMVLLGYAGGGLK